MGIDLTQEVASQISRALGVPAGLVHCTLDGDVVAVTVTGTLHGRSARNAVRRRQQALRAAKRAIANRDLHLSVTFAVRDAVSVIEDLVRTTATLIVGQAPDAIYVNIDRSGKTSAVVAVSKIDDGSKMPLEQALLPLLNRAGLALTGVSLVSPMREDVSDARILRVTKILAPCDGVAVSRRLRKSDNVDISADLVHRRLDLLRQRGLLIYLGNRRFALTLKGLASVPISTSRRDSSDIERVLALARSKW